MDNGCQKRMAVVIVDHGSRRKEANAMLSEIVNAFRQQTSFSIVEPAHLEIVEPSIPNAIHACVNQGAEHVVVSPFFLSPGRHSQVDIPKIVESTIVEGKLGVSYSIAQPIGTDPMIIQLLQKRVEHALGE
eukprot:g7760.t1